MAQKEEEASALRFLLPMLMLFPSVAAGHPLTVRPDPSPSVPLQASSLGQPCVREPCSRLAPDHGAACSPQTSRGPAVNGGRTTRSCRNGSGLVGESRSSGAAGQVPPVRRGCGRWCHRGAAASDTQTLLLLVPAPRRGAAQAGPRAPQQGLGHPEGSMGGGDGRPHGSPGAGRDTHVGGLGAQRWTGP